MAEEYYADAFDSCSEEGEEEEEEIVFSGPEEEVKDKGHHPAYRTTQQVLAAPQWIEWNCPRF